MKSTKKILITIIGLMTIPFVYGQSIDTIEIQDDTIQSFNVQNAISNIKELSTSVEDITQELFKLDDKERSSGEVSEKYRETRKEIVSIISDINTTTETVNKLLRQLTVYQKEIANAGNELKDSRQGVKVTKEYIADFANFIYKLDNQLYNNEGTDIDEIKLLLHSDNIPRTLANDYIVQSLTLQLNDLITNFNENEQEQLATIKRLNTIKKEAQKSLGEYETSLEKLQQKKNYLMQFLNIYKKDKITKEITLNTLFESNKNVQDKIKELLAEIKKGVYKTDISIEEKIQILNETSDDKEQHPIAWPLYPIYEIQTYFQDAQYQKTYGIPHLGIQINATQKTPIYAARDGVIYFVANNDDLGINRVMILHTDGFVTVYEYLNSSIVKIGDTVTRGQLIGYSGGEPGTRGAGFISKGPNLTFMVFKNGIAVDPFDILDASIVQDKDVLPEGYKIKYLRDKYARPIDITNLKIMTGETLAERENQFLRLYGVGLYKNTAFRGEVVKNTNIDKDVVICIAFAESTLGKYLSTPNNIGNVGNNDRGDRVTFGNAYGGARSIALTLNNQHLGHYHTIKQLSRYGNKDGKIYASSPINWQTNVLKCLSQIKGYYIPEDFPFRTGPNPNLTAQEPEKIDIEELFLKK